MSAEKGFLPFNRWIVLSTLVLPIILIITSVFPGVTWTDIERKNSIGPYDYRLEVEMDAVGFEYELNATSSEDGGFLGGAGGGIGNGFSKNRTRKSYTQVRGEFLDNMGVLYDSYRTKTYLHELIMQSPPGDIEWGAGSPSAYLSVSLEADMIPYWPDMVSHELTVTVKFTECDLWDVVGDEQRSNLSVTLSKVIIGTKTGYSNEKGTYQGDDKVISEKSANIRLFKPGDSVTFTFDTEYPKDLEVAGFFAEIEANLTDFWGRAERSPLTGKANPINVRPMGMSDSLRVIGIPLALPLLAISAILLIINSAITVITGRPRLYLAIPSFLLAGTAPLWFWMGIKAAASLLEERLEGASEGITYGIGLYLAVAAALLSLVPLGLTIAMRMAGSRSKGNGDIAKQNENEGGKGEKPSSTDAVTFRKVQGKEDGSKGRLVKDGEGQMDQQQKDPDEKDNRFRILPPQQGS